MDKRTYEFIEDYMLSCMGDSAHDKEHVYRVLKNALVIAGGMQDVNYDVLITACLLHDIARPEQIQEPRLCHAAVGAEKAYVFLLQSGCSVGFAEEVRNCIRTHRFRNDDQPESPEAKILFDADKLDVVGAIGVARTLVYKGTVSDPLYTRRPDGMISDGTDDVESSFFREYKFKLEKLYDRFYTEKGRELALERKAAAEAFYKSLYNEVSFFDRDGQALLDRILD